MSTRLGELLVREKLITVEQLKGALNEQRLHGGTLGYHLVKMGIIAENVLLSFLSRQFGVSVVDPSAMDIPEEVIRLVPPRIVQKYHVIPLKKAGSVLTVAIADPSNISAIDDIKFFTGTNVVVQLATDLAIKKAIDRFYDMSASLSDVMDGFKDEGMDYSGDEEELDASVLATAATEAPVVKLVNFILADAIKKQASDIHVEPYEKVFRVRFRIDGVLYEIMNPPSRLKNAIISRIKIMSKLDIAERRLPQDGRIKLIVGKGKEMDFRVSVLPTLFGEKVVLRLLDKSNLQLDMTRLGFEEKALTDFMEAIHRPYGMVLVTGPTGSGKTTTLYSALAELNKVTENISTAEDPVEFNLMGINQVQIHDDIGLTFAAALRSFLRQDPDIIMVGEIRDFETAEIGVKAALTGHLVLSTLHTNDAPSTINRLLNMGVEPFLVSSSVNLILAQRLVRKICPDCKEEVSIPAEVLRNMGLRQESDGEIICYKGKGCLNCNQSGYRGRIALYEVMPMYEELKEMVLVGASAMEIKKETIRLGTKTLRQSGLTKILEGVTTIEEVARTTVAD
ncbi:MAG: type IV-A pilus assembly ATPase PilB [Thermodesulfobacteriota bacterium]|nr:type IV-A pilus assembly ATPase PilB [Thermodesulfobacteriota bacterium]